MFAFQMTMRNLCLSCAFKLNRLRAIQNTTVLSKRARHGKTKTVAHQNGSDDICRLKMRYVYVYTSVGRWEDVPDGIIFDVGYADSHPDSKYNPATPIVVGLHSTPGSHEDLVPFLESFVKMGCRVIAPNFPGLGNTEGLTPEHGDIFTHSTDEKAEFIRDFLANIGINQVDMVIAHGAACYPMLRLCTTEETCKMFKSAVFITPWPHRPFRGIQLYSVYDIIKKMWDRPFLRPFVKVLALTLRKRSWQKKASMLDVVTLAYTISGIDLEQAGGSLVAADLSKLPRVVFFCSCDQFVEKPLSLEYLDLMGISEDDIMEVNSDGKIIKPEKISGFPKGVMFESGGQNVHREFSRIVVTDVWKLLKHVRHEIL